MKRIASALLSGFMLIGFTSCDQAKASTSDTESTTVENTSTTTTAEITTESTTIETTESSSIVPVSMTLEDIRKDLFKYCDKTSIINIYSEKTKKPKQGLPDGINNCLYSYYFGPWELEEPDDYYFMESSIYILECDMDSEIYKNLKQGDTVNIFLRENYETELVINSINGQYALCIYAWKENNNEWNEGESMPDYTIANMQDIYNAFNSYK